MARTIAKQVPPDLIESYWDYFNDIPRIFIEGYHEYSRTMEYCSDPREFESISFARTWSGYEEYDEFEESMKELCQVHDIDEELFKNLFVNSDEYEDAACVTLNMVRGGDWKHKTIGSCMTGENATVYYDSNLYDDWDVDRIEAAYFGDLTQWEVFNEKGEFIAAMFCEVTVRDVSEYIGDILRSYFNISVESSEIKLEWCA